MTLNEIDKLFGIAKSTRTTILWVLLVINILALSKPIPNSEACKKMTRPHKVCDNYKNYFLFATSERKSRHIKKSYFGVLGVWFMFEDGNYKRLVTP